jgi:hypothetical protein
MAPPSTKPARAEALAGVVIPPYEKFVEHGLRPMGFWRAISPTVSIHTPLPDKRILSAKDLEEIYTTTPAERFLALRSTKGTVAEIGIQQGFVKKWAIYPQISFNLHSCSVRGNSK